MPISTIISYCVLFLNIYHGGRPKFKGSVPVSAYERPILLVGREHMNRAVHGDVVAVEVFDKKDWRAPGDEVVDQEGAAVWFTS